LSHPLLLQTLPQYRANIIISIGPTGLIIPANKRRLRGHRATLDHRATIFADDLAKAAPHQAHTIESGAAVIGHIRTGLADIPDAPHAVGGGVNRIWALEAGCPLRLLEAGREVLLVADSEPKRPAIIVLQGRVHVRPGATCRRHKPGARDDQHRQPILIQRPLSEIGHGALLHPFPSSRSARCGNAPHRRLDFVNASTADARWLSRCRTRPPLSAPRPRTRRRGPSPGGIQDTSNGANVK